MDGLIFENGAAFNTVTADKDGHIRADLNDAFAAQVRSLGTSGERQKHLQSLQGW